jgi:hypothetical protein
MSWGRRRAAFSVLGTFGAGQFPANAGASNKAGAAPAPANNESPPVFTARNYGAIGDGRSHPAGTHLANQGVTSLAELRRFRGGLYRFASALTNEMDWLGVQAAINAAAVAPNAGTVIIPSGEYQLDQELTLPNPGGHYDHNGVTAVVALRGEGMLNTTLYWPRDLGPGSYAIRSLGATARTQIRDLRIRGSSGVPLGASPRRQDGIAVATGFHLENLLVTGFRAGISITGDHATFRRLQLGKCHYGLYWASGGSSYGDHLFYDLSIDNCAFASIACAWDNGIDSSKFFGGWIGNSPYGFYREAAPNGSSAGGFMTNSTFSGLAVEGVGNAWIYGENFGAGSEDHMVNVQWIGGNTPSIYPDYRLATKPHASLIRVARMAHCRFVGVDLGGGSNYAHVGSCLIDLRAGDDNHFDGAREMVYAATAAKPAIRCLINAATMMTWRAQSNVGVFRHTQDTVVAGQVMQRGGAYLGSGGYGTSHPPGGGIVLGVAVAGNSGGAGQMCPIATEGFVEANKTAAPLNYGDVVMACPGPDFGRTALRRPGNPILGIVVERAAADDARARIELCPTPV